MNVHDREHSWAGSLLLTTFQFVTATGLLAATAYGGPSGSGWERARRAFFSKSISSPSP
jgi:hypothetical protein